MQICIFIMFVAFQLFKMLLNGASVVNKKYGAKTKIYTILQIMLLILFVLSLIIY